MSELEAYRVAAETCPEIPAARAALGCARARGGHFAEGIGHIRYAVEHDPFDGPAARALEAALAAAGDEAGAEEARGRRRVLAKAAPKLVADPGPPAAAPAEARTGLASLIVLCCNEVEVT